MKDTLRKAAPRAIAATLAMALALSSVSVAPARAGTEEQAGALAFGSILALITAGIVISNLNQNPGVVSPKPIRPRAPLHPRPDPRKALPGYCKVSVPYGHDRGTYFGRQCLIRNFSYWPMLPDRCERKVNLPGRPGTTVYQKSCLARYGYRTGMGPRPPWR